MQVHSFRSPVCGAVDGNTTTGISLDSTTGSNLIANASLTTTNHSVTLEDMTQDLSQRSFSAASYGHAKLAARTHMTTHGVGCAEARGGALQKDPTLGPSLWTHLLCTHTCMCRV